MTAAGEPAQDSGTYRCDKCGQEVTCAKGEPIPPCCKGADFKMVKKDK